MAARRSTAKGKAPAKATPAKPATGRPSVYRPAYDRQAYHACLLGATDADLARIFDVSGTTITNWKQAHPSFLASLKAGKDVADAQVAQSLFRRARGYSHRAVKIAADAKTGAEHIVPYIERYPPDTVAAIFWLKNRRPDLWRDRHEMTGKDGAPLTSQAIVIGGQEIRF